MIKSKCKTVNMQIHRDLFSEVTKNKQIHQFTNSNNTTLNQPQDISRTHI